jgi:hypothetical protein
MATALFTVLGNAWFGPLGGLAGGVLGSLVDRALLPQQKVQGPRLDDLRVTISSYGAQIPLVYGPENRATGNVIWSTGLIESKKKKGGSKLGTTPSQVTFTYRLSCAILLGEGFIGTIGRIFANSKVIFDPSKATVALPAPTPQVGMVATKANGTHAVFDLLRFYQGNGTQQIDPTIESYKGVGNTQAFRFRSYLVLQDLQLADFGNAMPNIEVELIAQASVTDEDIANDVCARSGVTDAVTVSLSNNVRRGYIVSRADNGVAALEPLATAGNFDMAEQAGQVRFIKRGGPILSSISLGDMGARQAGDSSVAEPLHLVDAGVYELPRRATVSFSDPALDYQTNSQPVSRTLGASDNELSAELPVTMSPDEARQIADRILWDAWSSRRAAQFAGSDRMRSLGAGNVIALPVADTMQAFRITRTNRGANGVIQFEALADDPEALTSEIPGAPGNIPENSFELPGPTRLQLIDGPAAIAEADDTGFYWVVTADSAGWRGVELNRSTDGGASYEAFAESSVVSVIGNASTTLANGPCDFWDHANTLTVVLERADDELVSLSELDTLNGGNLAWVGPATGQGGEVVQFMTATLIAPGTYKLSELLRGRFGTEYAASTHAAGEVFVLLDPSVMGRSDFSSGDWNKDRLYKPVSVLSTLIDTAAQHFTNTGESKRCLTVMDVRGDRTGSGSDLIISWKRRSRLIVPGFGSGPQSLNEAAESYETDVVVGGNVKRTLASTQPSVTYTAALQAADGIAAGSPITVRIYQMSDVRGRGRQVQAAL